MGQKRVEESIFGRGGGGGGDMKRSPSEFALEELFSKDAVEIPPQRGRVFDDADALLSLEDHPESFADVCAGGDLTFPFRNQEIMSGFPSCGGLTDTLLWSENVTSKQSSISAPIDSQSSICVSSPNSATKLKGRDNQATGTTSGSSPEQSDGDDIEIEAGPCEQSTDTIDVKRIKRMASNRESARRSRSRKQAHLQELEQQAEHVRGENASLYKQLTDASQQFKDATTNNRVLKSDVEALRAKVKLAEDMVARGSLTSSLSHLLQNHMSTPPQSFSSHNMSRLTPTIPVCGDDDVPYRGITAASGQNSTLGLENADAFNSSTVKNGIISDAVSCVSENWVWESHAPTVSK